MPTKHSVHIANLTLQDAVDILYYVFPEGEAVIRREGWPETQLVVLDGALRHQKSPDHLPEPALPPGETLRVSRDWVVTPAGLGRAWQRLAANELTQAVGDQCYELHTSCGCY